MTTEALREGRGSRRSGRRLARLYLVLTAVNRAVESADDEISILQAACGTVVHVGHFLMSWAGRIDAATKEVRPVASAGHADGYLDVLKIRVVGERSEGPTGLAIRERRTVVCDDIADDPRMVPWREEALRRGYRSSVGLPLVAHDQVLGVLTVYADEPRRFDEGEIELLEELGRVVSIGLEGLGAKRQEREAQAALQASRELFDASVETMLDAFGIYSAVREEGGAIVDFRVQYVNEEACRYAGAPCEMLLGHVLLELAPDWAATGQLERYRRLVENGAPIVEASVVGGGPFWRDPSGGRIFEIRAFKVKDGFAQTWRDVTERRAAQDALRRSEAALRDVQRFASLASWTWEASTNVVSCSDELYRILGIEPGSPELDTLEGHRRHYTPESWARVLPLMEQAVTDGVPYDVDLEVVRPDGERRWISSHAVPVLDAGGTVTTLRGILHDITARKTATLALAESESRFRTSLETMLDPFVLLRAVRNEAGRIVDFIYDYANEAALHANGLTREEHIGRRLLEVLPEHEASGLLAAYAHVIDSDEPLVLDDYRFVDTWGGETMARVFDIRASAIGETLAYTWRDVTERRHAERQKAQELEERVRARTAELQAANAELERLRDAEVDRAALEERTRLSRELHDGLAQDLWLAKLKASRLLALPSLDPEARRLSDEVVMAVDAGLAEASWAVQALRPDSGDGAASFEAKLRGTVEDFGDRFGLRAEMQAGRHLPKLSHREEAELLRITQEALTNVQRHADATAVTVELGRREEVVTLRIRDNGRGFDAAAVEGSFGLASMRERAAIVGGRLTIRSAPGAGTCVTVEVPA